MDHIFEYDSPLGRMIISGTDEFILSITFSGQKQEDKFLPKEYETFYSFPIKKAVKWLDIYFSGKEPDFIPPLQLEGTAFQKRVWELLLQIPYGTIMTYSDIALKIGKEIGKEKMSAQAVGGAVGRNPIGIIVPCHRVIGKNGSLTGYAGGLDKKKKLLELEGIRICK